jgi:hypothetical protein
MQVDARKWEISPRHFVTIECRIYDCRLPIEKPQSFCPGFPLFFAVFAMKPAPWQFSATSAL